MAGRLQTHGYERRAWPMKERNQLIRREHKMNTRHGKMTATASFELLGKAFGLTVKTVQHVVYRIGYS